MHAEIIAIGDEIASGQLLDTNTQWLSQRLEETGIRVLYHSTVGDERTACVETFRHAIRRADLVIATGGLGPTADDLTREALADAAGRPLVLDPKALGHLRAWFARRKRQMPRRNEQQAMFPEGSRVVANPHGTAPGIDLEVLREGAVPCRVFALPGVPAEMKEMWHGTLAAELAKLRGTRNVVRHRRIKCFGAGESDVEAMLPDLIRRGRTPRVGINASQTTIILRITAEGPDEAACDAAMQPTIATIRQCLGKLVFGEEDDELQDAVLRLLRQQDKTLATAEWGTAGLVAQWLASAQTADAHYLGGLVTAGETSSMNLLGVTPELLAGRSPCSREVVGAMAAGCRRHFGSDYALAVGAFPEADPAAEEPPPVFFALAAPEGVQTKPFPYAGQAALLKVFCAKRALNLVRLALLED